MARNFKLRGELDLKDNATKKVKNFSDKTVGSFKKLLPVLGVAGVAGAMTALVSKTLVYADKLGKMSTRLGVATQEFDKLRQVADLSGVRFEALSIGMQRLGRRVADAAKGAGPAAKSLKELGLSAEELTKIPLDQQLRVVLGRLEGVENQSEKVRLAFSLLDSEGVGLIQMSKDLDKNLAKMTSNFDDSKVRQAEAFNDSMTKLREVFSQLAIRVIPVLTKSMNALSTAWDFWAKQFSDPTPEQQIAKVRKNIEILNTARDKLLAKGGGGAILDINTKMLEKANAELEQLEKNIKKTAATSTTVTPTIDTSKIVDDSLSKEVQKTDETTQKINELRQRLQESLKNLEIERLQFIGQNEQAEISMVQNKYALLLEEAKGNADNIKLIEEAKNKELGLINDRFRKTEAEKRLKAASERMAVNENIAGEERARQSQAIKNLVDDFKEGEKEKMEVATKTKDFFVNNFSDAFGAVVSGSKKAGDAFKEMVQGMLAQLAKMAASKAFNQLLSSGGGYGSAFASLGSIFGFAGGGNVKANEPIVVGEKGPEIFTPRKSGMIIPNDQVESKYVDSNTTKSGGTTNNESNVSVNVNLDASNSNITDPAQANKIGTQLAQMVKSEVIGIIADQKRYGGMLYQNRRRTA